MLRKFPRPSRRYLLGPLTALPFLVLTLAAGAGTPPHPSNLLIVVDGLRPDYITPERMPHLHALGERGVFGETHSPAFPSVTRVNSASISTGSYPRTHGLIHNTMFLEEVSDEPFSTGTFRELQRLDAATGGKLLTTPTLAEILDAHGLHLLATGSGGGGNTLLQNPKGHGFGIRSARGLFLPEDLREATVAAVGEPPSSNSARTVWSFDSYLHLARSDAPPAVTLLWINETDSAGHTHGVGAPETLEAVANVDRQIGRLTAALEEHGLTDRVNIFVTTDHGFTSNTGRFSLRRIMGDAGLADEVRVVSNMVYLRRENPELLVRVVEALQRNEEAGAIYTRPARPGASEGMVPGTLSTAVVQWDHERSADVLVSPAWSDEVNEFGFAGATTRSGVASHGSDSPYDLHIRLVAAGPDLKSGLRSHVPTGNVDLAPTILHLLGLAPPEQMDGRVLHELLKDGPEPSAIRVHEHTHQAAVGFPDGFRYKVELDTLQVGSTVYIRGARTARERTEPNE